MAAADAPAFARRTRTQRHPRPAQCAARSSAGPTAGTPKQTAERNAPGTAATRRGTSAARTAGNRAESAGARYPTATACGASHCCASSRAPVCGRRSRVVYRSEAPCPRRVGTGRAIVSASGQRIARATGRRRQCACPAPCCRQPRPAAQTDFRLRSSQERRRVPDQTTGL